MSSFFDELGSYIDTNAALVVFDNATGRNFFLNELPPDPETAAAIFGQNGTTLGAARDVPGLNFPRFQIVARAKAYEDAAALMTQIRNAIHGLIGVNTSSYRILRCHAEQEASPLGQDAQGRHEFSCNFIAEYHAT